MFLRENIFSHSKNSVNDAGTKDITMKSFTAATGHSANKYFPNKWSEDDETEMHCSFTQQTELPAQSSCKYNIPDN